MLTEGPMGRGFMHCLTPGFPYTQEDKEEKEASSPTRTLIQMMNLSATPQGLRELPLEAPLGS